MSGGVDSSVAAYLLKQEGHEVIGMFMKNWHDETVTLNSDCPWLEDSNDALLVANQLGIPFQTIDLSEEYRKRIVDYMFSEYKNGRTPNPDVLCNREIKFDLFLDIATSIGADFVATGHYCQKEILSDKSGSKKIYRLLAGNDANKDQSYFLCQLSQSQLAKALFPIGHLKKSEVRKIANQLNLTNANKKDSQGLCFIGKVSLPEFLQQQLPVKPGNVVAIPSNFSQTETLAFSEDFSEEQLQKLARPVNYLMSDGKIIGTHNGAHFYTIGQRKGLHIGGFEKPLFILSTNISENVIFVGEGENHPGLYRHALRISKNELNWLRQDLAMQENETRNYMVRIRYRQALAEAKLIMKEKDLFILFKDRMKSIAAGQFAAWYCEGELLGSGVIS